jgi:hypothetical protein
MVEYKYSMFWSQETKLAVENEGIAVDRIANTV